MTGWRCGWTIGPAAVIARVQRDPEPLDVERQLDHAEGRRRGADADRRHCVTEMLDEYRTRRDQLYDWLSADPRHRAA